MDETNDSSRGGGNLSTYSGQQLMNENSHIPQLPERDSKDGDVYNTNIETLDQYYEQLELLEIQNSNHNSKGKSISK